MSPWCLKYSRLVIHPPFAWQQGSLTSILSWALQLPLVGLRCLRAPQSCGVQGHRDWGSPFLVKSACLCSYSIGSKVLPEWGWGALGFLSPAGFRAFALGPALWVELWAWERIWSDRRFFWTFASKSPLGVESAYLCMYSIWPKVFN